MNDIVTRVSLNKNVASDFFRIRFPVEWGKFTPGQFVMVGVPAHDVFLRRPFGIVKLERGEMEVCYKVVGKGTLALSKIQRGTEIKILGPCGRGFDVKGKFKTAVIVAGGYGVASLFGLAKELCKAKRRVIFYYGAKGRKEFLYMNELKGMKIDLMTATEDGSLGFKGLVTARLLKEIDNIESPRLFACGPHGLLESVAKIAKEYSLPAQVSLESHMACGLGVCLGCVCKDARGEYVRICKEGPVFDVKELSI